MKGGVPVLPIKELWQEAKPEAKIEVNHGGQEPGISMPVQAGGEAVEFADRVMQEANALLKGRQEPIKSEQEAESAGLKPVKTEHKEMFAAADLDGKKGDSDTAGAKGTNQPGNGIAGQNVATAVISEDGRIQFQESRAEPAPLQQTQQKDSVLSQIVERVRTHVGKEKSEFFLQLKPEHLGGLSIMLSADDKGVVAKLTTANQDVQYMLQSDMNQLQAALREKGIHVVHMEVIYDQTANSTAKDNGGNDQRWGGNTGNSHGRVPENVESAAAFYDDMSYYDMLAEQGGSVEFSA